MNIQDGEVPCTDFDYTNSTCYYTSGFIHTVHLTDLIPGTKYTYKISGEGTTFMIPFRHYTSKPDQPHSHSKEQAEALRQVL